MNMTSKGIEYIRKRNLFIKIKLDTMMKNWSEDLIIIIADIYNEIQPIERLRE